MLIFLSAPVFDLNGVVKIKPSAKSKMSRLERRVNVSKTLDGGVSVNDGGFSHGDRAMTFIFKSREESERVRLMFELYPRLTVSTYEGVFDAALHTFEIGGADTTLTLFIIGKLS